MLKNCDDEKILVRSTSDGKVGRWTGSMYCGCGVKRKDNKRQSITLVARTRPTVILLHSDSVRELFRSPTSSLIKILSRNGKVAVSETRLKIVIFGEINIVSRSKRNQLKAHNDDVMSSIR